MKKFNLAKLLSLVLVFTLLMGTFAVLPASAAEAPSIKIVSNNVFFGEKLHLMYAVETANAPAGAEIVVTISDGTNTYATEEKEDDTYGTVYVSKVGVAAQNIATVYTATATLKDGDTVLATDTQTYSVLEYLYTRLLVSTEKTEAQVAMYNSLLDYAAKAEAVLCADRETKIGDYVLVTVLENGTIDGTKTSGIYANGTVLDGFTTDLVAEKGYVVSWSVTSYDAKGNSTTAAYTPDAIAEGLEVNGKHLVIVPEIKEDMSNKDPEELATFQFGANVTAGTHKDNSNSKTSYTESANGYTLNLTNADKMYPSSNDAQGNSALKFGTKTVAGKFTLVVGDNVTKVIIRVAGYKDANAKVTINGTAYTITTLSDDGAYTEIEIDTTSNKTITFTTASGGYRAMMDSITFIGYPED
jgi:hypothetical protein